MSCPSPSNKPHHTANNTYAQYSTVLTWRDMASRFVGFGGSSARGRSLSLLRPCPRAGRLETASTASRTSSPTILPSRKPRNMWWGHSSCRCLALREWILSSPNLIPYNCPCNRNPFPCSLFITKYQGSQLSS